MFCMLFPGGVVAGVVGIERAVLLSPVSIDNGWLVPSVPGSDWPLQSLYELLALPLPMTLEALVGGVGKVWALSRLGLPVPACVETACEF